MDSDSTASTAGTDSTASTASTADARDPIVSRYSALARTALGGRRHRRLRPGCFRPATVISGRLPIRMLTGAPFRPGALECQPRAAGTRSRSPTCGRVRRSLTWGRAAALTCCYPPAGSARPLPPTALTPAPTCSPSPGRTRPAPACSTRTSCTDTSRTSRCPMSTWTSSSPTASSTCPPTSPACWPRRSVSCGLGGPPGHQ